jgi:hypothetical protein
MMLITPMIKSKYWMIPASIIFIAAGIFILYRHHSAVATNDMLKLEVRPLEKPTGWGYDILVDNKIYIHQDCIPAIANQKTFVSRDEAMLVGNEVISKIQKGQRPAINAEDLKRLHVHY